MVGPHSPASSLSCVSYPVLEGDIRQPGTNIERPTSTLSRGLPLEETLNSCSAGSGSSLASSRHYWFKYVATWSKICLTAIQFLLRRPWRYLLGFILGFIVVRCRRFLCQSRYISFPMNSRKLHFLYWYPLPATTYLTSERVISICHIKWYYMYPVHEARIAYIYV